MNKLKKKKKKISTASRLKSKSQPGKRPINFKVFNHPKKKKHQKRKRKQRKKERKFKIFHKPTKTKWLSPREIILLCDSLFSSLTIAQIHFLSQRFVYGRLRLRRRRFLRRSEVKLFNYILCGNCLVYISDSFQFIWSDYLKIRVSKFWFSQY